MQQAKQQDEDATLKVNVIRWPKRYRTYQLLTSERRMIADDIIHRNTDGKGNALLDDLAIDLLRVEL